MPGKLPLKPLRIVHCQKGGDAIMANHRLELVDSHCHFDFAAFDPDRQAIWDQCRQMGMQHLLIPGVHPQQWTHAATLCEHHPGLVYAAGLHPWWLEKTPIDERQLEICITDELQKPRCQAIGECGLDALLATPVDQQLPVLYTHMALAKKMDVPIILHCVKAHNPMIRALKEHALTKGVIHAYSGSYEQALQYWQMGFYLGIGGTITYARAKKTRDAVSRLPLQALLLESDAPDMPIDGRQGQRNSPTSIATIAHTLASLRSESVEEIAQQTSANSRRLFNL